jgi:hypothetical protein
MKDFKVYIVWFIVWLLWIASFTYAAWNNGTIGGLFGKVWNEWRLFWSNIKNWTITKDKLIPALSWEISANTAKKVRTDEEIKEVISNVWYLPGALSWAISANTAKVVKTPEQIKTIIWTVWYLTWTHNWTFNVKEICDQNGGNCKTVADWLGGWTIQDPYFPPNQDPNCESSFYKSENTLDWVTWYYIQSCTGLKWETSDTSGKNWNNAKTYCSGRWTWWRLPTKNELLSIMTVKTKNSSGRYTALPSITYYNYWSATEHANYTYDAGWYGYFSTGYMSYHRKRYTSLHTICIHD